MPWRDLPTVKDHSLQPRHLGEVAMAADPALLKRIRACPFARGGRVRVRYRANTATACSPAAPASRWRGCG
jgi:hypothetical protein